MSNLEFFSVKQKTVNNTGTDNTAQQVQARCSRAANLSLVLRTHKVAGENNSSYNQKLSSELFMYTVSPKTHK